MHGQPYIKKSELNIQSVQKWQNEWERSSKGVITKSFFPKIADRLKLRINATPNFTAIKTGHGNIENILLQVRNNRQSNELM